MRLLGFLRFYAVLKPTAPTGSDLQRFAGRKSAANQMQIIANHMICKLLVLMLFGTLICNDLRLICSLQITANQSLPTFKKHCKTRANQRKSLQITPPENHRKKNADLQPDGV